MRLFLLPLSTRRTFVYCDKNFRVGATTKRISAGSSANRSNTDASAANSDQSSSSPSSSEPIPFRYIDKITDKAATTWADWERAPGGWKKKLTEYGNAALRSIPYEEWGLKSFPPLRQSRIDAVTEECSDRPVNVLFPPSLIKQANVQSTLLRLAQERQSMHQKRMWYCLIGAPLTLPFALVPIIPNIPGIYLVFRAWSHYRALYGARYLEFLVQDKLYRPMPSQQLDRIYKQANPSKDLYISQAKEELLLLTKSRGHEIAQTYEVNELGVELERAVEQVEKAIAEQDSAAKQAVRDSTGGKSN